MLILTPIARYWPKHVASQDLSSAFRAILDLRQCSANSFRRVEVWQAVWVLWTSGAQSILVFRCEKDRLRAWCAGPGNP